MNFSKGTEQISPGPIFLLGSGETSPSGRKAFEVAMQRISQANPQKNSPRIVLLETPAGFELNSAQVARRIGDFLSQHLQNYHPEIQVIPARKRGTVTSPDNPDVVKPILEADLIFMGPGSPSYAVRQLRNSLAWNYLVAAHRKGASLALASAATVAISKWSLPVYEIYKTGEDIHWKPGLDFFRPFGLSLVFIPHWNNNDGGQELDTRRCYMGLPRFELLLNLLPAGNTVVGLDENTTLMMDLSTGGCQVIGQGSITIQKDGTERQYSSGLNFSLDELGPFQFPDLNEGVPEDVWQQAAEARNSFFNPSKSDELEKPSQEVVQLLELRQAARDHHDWNESDSMRRRIADMGWQVIDTPEGQKLVKINQEDLC
ncbi:MAG: cysteinyl-tRNA synthetase [Omnitrophica WOR_2 bacterium]